MPMNSVAGLLLDAHRVPIKRGSGYVIYANIIRDQLGRFEDGQRVITSEVLAEHNGFVVTQNNVYRVIDWGDENKSFFGLRRQKQEENGTQEKQITPPEK